MSCFPKKKSRRSTFACAIMCPETTTPNSPFDSENYRQKPGLATKNFTAKNACFCRYFALFLSDFKTGLLVQNEKKGSEWEKIAYCTVVQKGRLSSISIFCNFLIETCILHVKRLVFRRSFKQKIEKEVTHRFNASWKEYFFFLRNHRKLISNSIEPFGPSCKMLFFHILNLFYIRKRFQRTLNNRFHLGGKNKSLTAQFTRTSKLILECCACIPLIRPYFEGQFLTPVRWIVGWLMMDRSDNRFSSLHEKIIDVKTKHGAAFPKSNWQ